MIYILPVLVPMCTIYETLTLFLSLSLLTHWGRVTHICVSKITIIGSDNGLSPGRRQAIIWTNAGILLIEPLGTNFSAFLIEIYIFSAIKMHLKLSSAIWRPFCLGLNELKLLISHNDRHVYHVAILVESYFLPSQHVGKNHPIEAKTKWPSFSR